MCGCRGAVGVDVGVRGVLVCKCEGSMDVCTSEGGVGVGFGVYDGCVGVGVGVRGEWV